MILNLGVPRTGTVYTERALNPIRPRRHYVDLPSDWSHASFHQLPDSYRDDLKVAVVRNPFELLVSHFAFLRRADVLVHHYDANLVALSFRDYVTLVAHRKHHYPQRHPLFFQLFDGDWQLIPDYLGRYETLHDDLDCIAGLAGATYTPGPPVNVSRHEDWRRYYDEDLYQTVEDAWRLDLAYFGYDRSGPNSRALTTFGLHPRPVDHRPIDTRGLRS